MRHRVILCVILSFIFSLTAQAGPVGSTRDYRDSPHWLGDVPIMDFSSNAVMAGSYVLAGNGCLGMDILRPEADGLAYAGTVDLGLGNVTRLDWRRDGTLTAGSEEDGLRIFDATDLYAPVLEAELAPGLGVWFTLWCGDVLVAAVEDSLWVWPDLPGGAVAKLGLPTDADRLAFDRERYLLYTASGAGLGVVDLNDPTAPALIAQLTTPPYVSDVVVLPGTTDVLLTSEEGSLDLVDVTDPTHPVVAASHELDSQPTSLALRGDLVWIGTNEGVKAWDVSDPAAARELDHFGMNGPATDLALAGNHLIWNEGWSLHLLAQGDATAEPDTLLCSQSGQCTAVLYDGDYVYAGERNGDFAILKPVHGDVEARLALGAGQARALSRNGNDILMAKGLSGLDVIDVGDPRAPTLLMTVPVPGAALDVCVDAGRCWLACGADGLVGMELASGYEPAYFAVPGDDATAVAADQGLVALGLQSGMVLLYDAADIAAGPLGSVGVEGPVTALAWDEGRLHVATEEGGFRVVDVRVPAQPVVRVEYDARNRTFLDLAIRDGVAYMAADNDGVWALDLTDPAGPRHVGRLPSPSNVTGLAVGGVATTAALVACMWEGALVGPLHEADPHTAVVSAPRPARLRSNAPNPFNPRTTIRFELPVPTEVDLAVFDVMGRRVTTLATGLRQSGAHAVDWDGRDAAGRACGSGTYMAVLRTERGTATRPLTLVK